MHMKYNTKWWHSIFYTETGTYSTESTYWKVKVYWLFNQVVYEKTIDSGFIVKGEKRSAKGKTLSEIING